MSSAKFAKLDQPEAADSSGSERDEYNGRISEEVRRHDEETLTAEEEAERLLGGGTEKSDGFGQRFADKREARRQKKREARREKRSRRKGGRDESETMYDMEKARRSSSESSSEADMRRLKQTQAQAKRKVSPTPLEDIVMVVVVLIILQTSRASKILKFALIHIVIIAAFLALLYGASRTSSGSKATPPIVQKLSNGTHIFAPTTLLISLDGFRADFLTRNLTPTLNSFIRSGVSP